MPDEDAVISEFSGLVLDAWEDTNKSDPFEKGYALFSSSDGIALSVFFEYGDYKADVGWMIGKGVRVLIRKRYTCQTQIVTT